MMLTFGDKLKREREIRKKKLEDIAGKTELQVAYLEGLEQNEFDALPGPSFGKLYIRAYAEVLGFDPEPLIAEYDRERSRREQQELAETESEDPLEPRRERRRKRAWLEEVTSEDPAGTPVDPPSTAPSIEARPAEPDPPLASEDASEGGEAPQVPSVELPPVTPHRLVAPRSNRSLPLVMVVIVGLVAVVAWAYATVFRSDDTAGDRIEADYVRTAPAREIVTDSTPPSEPVELPPERRPNGTPQPVSPPEPAVAPAPSMGQLTVREFALGRQVVNRRIEDRTQHFEEGGAAWFSTRVLGGVSGQSIRHVWLREGKPVQSIKLRLGGPHWRTHSRKTLWGVGSWAVEARDDEGRVLARATFDCVPAGS